MSLITFTSSFTLLHGHTIKMRQAAEKNYPTRRQGVALKITTGINLTPTDN